jgi:hypothetical protein
MRLVFFIAVDRAFLHFDLARQKATQANAPRSRGQLTFVVKLHSDIILYRCGLFWHPPVCAAFVAALWQYTTT